MSLTFEMFRQINMFLPLFAFGFLGFRTVKSWPADWAKPDHVWHYRGLLIAVLLGVLITSLGSIMHEVKHSPATWVSPAYTCQSILVLAICFLWPKVRGKL